MPHRAPSGNEVLDVDEGVLAAVCFDGSQQLQNDRGTKQSEARGRGKGSGEGTMQRSWRHTAEHSWRHTAEHSITNTMTFISCTHLGDAVAQHLPLALPVLDPIAQVPVAAHEDVEHRQQLPQVRDQRTSHSWRHARPCSGADVARDHLVQGAQGCQHDGWAPRVEGVAQRGDEGGDDGQQAARCSGGLDEGHGAGGGHELVGVLLLQGTAEGQGVAEGQRDREVDSGRVRYSQPPSCAARRLASRSTATASAARRKAPGSSSGSALGPAAMQPQ